MYECENRLYDERLRKELAALQDAARKMLERIATTNV
jgi:hypothetical protein